MERTSTPGIYKRGSRYVVVWQHRGRQHKSFHRTLSEAREAQGARRQPGERKPATRERFEDYALREPLLERAIGVIYRPETERTSHYFEARLAEQFDAVLHFDETHAVTPIPSYELEGMPETYPFGL